jgi:hypothetical protein
MKKYILGLVLAGLFSASALAQPQDDRAARRESYRDWKEGVLDERKEYIGRSGEKDSHSGDRHERRKEKRARKEDRRERHKEYQDWKAGVLIQRKEHVEDDDRRHHKGHRPSHKREHDSHEDRHDHKHAR